VVVFLNVSKIDKKTRKYAEKTLPLIYLAHLNSGSFNMGDKLDYVTLVERAQLGDKECLDRLTELAQERLRADVYRLTLQYNLTQDIVQETLLEMFKILGKLRRADRFWPWLYRIALNKIRLHHRTEHCHKTVPVSATGDGDVEGTGREAMANLIGRELKEIVLGAMRKLKPRHRLVLTMRCYREMTYSEIAESMGCSEFAAKMLFYRAKKSLQRQLARHGFSKGSLLMALVLFGQITAPSEAAAQVCVTAEILKVGVAATLAGMAVSKTAVVSVATAVVVVAGSVAISPSLDKQDTGRQEILAKTPHVLPAVSEVSAGGEEYWYCYPEGADGPVMVQLMKWDSQGKHSYCQWLQNDHANHYFDKRKNTIYKNNYRVWAGDLAVQRLPTDSPELRDFLSEVQGRQDGMEYVPDKKGGLLVIAAREAGKNNNCPWVIRHYNILEEEYFRYNWPAGVRIEDNRDVMHRRGWTYFTVAGELNGQEVSGAGRLPFVYAISREYFPWLRLQVGDGLRIEDDGMEARVYGFGGKTVADYKGGSFFKGLARPWMGLHTVDTVRRDAAEEWMRFETKYKPGEAKAQVTLAYESGKLIYSIDMEKDVVDKIRFSGRQNEELRGELRFTYLQDIDNIGDGFAEPSVDRYSRSREEVEMLWLVQLTEGTLGK
jgi:RNA polymerase sigma-70 factor (ECF subfamily)